MSITFLRFDNRAVNRPNPKLEMGQSIWPSLISSKSGPKQTKTEILDSESAHGQG